MRPKKVQRQEVHTQVAVTVETHRLLKMLRDRYDAESFSDAIWQFAQDRDPEMMRDLLQIMKLENRIIERAKSDE